MSHEMRSKFGKNRPRQVQMQIQVGELEVKRPQAQESIPDHHAEWVGQSDDPVHEEVKQEHEAQEQQQEQAVREEDDDTADFLGSDGIDEEAAGYAQEDDDIDKYIEDEEHEYESEGREYGLDDSAILDDDGKEGY